MTPPDEITDNIFAMDNAERAARGIENLPSSLREAVDVMRTDKLILDTLGDHIVSQYTEGKYREWDEYRTHVSSWEIDKYLTIY